MVLPVEIDKIGYKSIVRFVLEYYRFNFKEKIEKVNVVIKLPATSDKEEFRLINHYDYFISLPSSRNALLILPSKLNNSERKRIVEFIDLKLKQKKGKKRAFITTKERPLTDDSEELIKKIIQLRKRKYSIRLISQTVGLEPEKVSRILLNNLRSSAWKSQGSIASSEGQISLKKSFNEIVDEQFDNLTDLQLEKANDLKKEFSAVLRESYEKIKCCGGFGTLPKLSPAVAYLFLKSKGYEVTKSDLVRGSCITTREFTRRLTFISSVFPAFLNRDKEHIVLNKLQRIKTQFNLPSEFLTESLELFRSFYPRLKTTTESVATGVICVLAVTKLGLEKPNCREICLFLKISGSTILYNVKRKIFPRVDLNSLVGSRKVIRDLLVLDQKSQESMCS